MKRIVITALLICLCAAPLSAGLEFGIQVGAYSPTSGLEDNDNGIMLGADIWFKFAFFGIKAEGFYVDSSGQYTPSGLGDDFSGIQLEVDNIFSLDLMYFPVGGLFFLQGGLNHTNFDGDTLDELTQDNKLGYEVGLGVSLFEKLMVQGKLMYTPGAFEGNALDSFDSLDSDVQGYMVSVAWHF